MKIKNECTIIPITGNKLLNKGRAEKGTIILTAEEIEKLADDILKIQDLNPILKFILENQEHPLQELQEPFACPRAY